MTFFQRTAAAVLSGLCLLGGAAAVDAHHIELQPFNAKTSRALLLTAQSVGVQVFTDKDPGAAKYCTEGLLGQANSGGQVLFCIEAHEGDVDALADTVRHELVHIAQFCKGRSVGATSALLYPDLQEKALQGAIELHMPVDKYNPAQYATEAEARVLAQLYNDQQVATLLRRHC